MSVTIKKIAEISGVSRSTVDKVLNNRPGVSDKVRQRVKSIAKELGYKPNIIGKALAYQNKPLVLAAVMPDNTFTRQAKVGINKAYKELKDFGVKVEIYTTKDYDIKEQISILSYLIDRKVSG
ncbi:MAG: LacI family DNA-binding transcriptional regulator [Acetivibrionales bacterium]